MMVLNWLDPESKILLLIDGSFLGYETRLIEDFKFFFDV